MTVSSKDETVPTWFLVTLFVIAVVLAIVVIYLLFWRSPGDGPIGAVPTATGTAEVGAQTITPEVTSIAEGTATPAPIARQTAGAGLTPTPTAEVGAQTITPEVTSIAEDTATPAPIARETAGAGPTPTPTAEPPTLTSEPASAATTTPVPPATSTLPLTAYPAVTSMPLSTRSPTASPTPIPTAAETAAVAQQTPTVQVVGETGTVEGQIVLQGRNDHGNVTLLVDGTLAGTTDASGSFSLAVPAGSHTIQASYPGYVIAEASDVEVGAGEFVRLPAISLRAGDTDSDGDIDLYDVVRCVINMGRDPAAADMHADVNGDGVIDFRDLILIQRNYREASPVPWK